MPDGDARRPAGGSSIIGAPRAASCDVRDMLCAQALAVVSQAIERLPRGQELMVLYNAEDVKRDLLVWAGERGYGVREVNEGALGIVRDQIPEKRMRMDGI